MALKDRSPAAPPKPSAGKKKKAPPPALEIHDASQRLVGTPLDWQQLQVPVADAFLPKAPLKLTPRALADAINDGVDLQLVDLRPRRYPGVTNPPRDEVVPFPGALVLPLHESDQLAASLSKRRWTVFIDSGNGLAESVAERFFKDGFVLVGVLEGDYPAWVAATDR